MSSRSLDRFKQPVLSFITKDWTEGDRAVRRMALHEVWHGPSDIDVFDSVEQDYWPGSYMGCIEALRPLAEKIGDLYIDQESDEVVDEEPDGGRCGYCSGSGVGLADPVESSRCSHCGGSGSEPLYGDWVRIEAKDIRRIVFGELIGNGL